MTTRRSHRNRYAVPTKLVTLALCAASTVSFTPLTSTRHASLATSQPLEATKLDHAYLDSIDSEVVSTTEYEEQLDQRRKAINPTPALIAAWQKYSSHKPQPPQKQLQLASKPASFFLALTLFFATSLAAAHPALAAMSGGRVGGGGYGRASPSMSRPMPRSYSPYSSYSRGYSSYQYRRPNVYINPGPTIVAPFAPPILTPFAPVLPFSPYGGGIAVARGPSFFDLLFLGAITFMIVNAIRGVGESAVDGLSSWSSDQSVASPLGTGTTIAQISVALQVPNRDDPQSILNVLPRLAQSANTERRAGLQNLTSQVALELLRRKGSIVSANTSFQHYSDRTKAEQAFAQSSLRERSKFEKEGFSKFRGTDWGASQSNLSSLDRGMAGQATVAVVTLLVEIDGDSTKLPRITSLKSVEEALRQLASDARVGECLQSAEILWTPEDRGETLTAREVAADYPELRSV